MILALENLMIEMLTLPRNPHAIQGRSTLKDKSVWASVLERAVPWTQRENLLWSAWAINGHNLWAIDDTTAQRLIVSRCTEANNSVADECQMNRNVKKWTSMSEGSNNFAILEDCVFHFNISFYELRQHKPLWRSKLRKKGKKDADKNRNFVNFAHKFKALPWQQRWELHKDQLEENSSYYWQGLVTEYSLQLFSMKPRGFALVSICI